MMVPLSYYIALCVALFVLGALGAVVRRNGLVALMCIALMFCAAILAFAVGAQRHGTLEAQVWGVLVLVATVAELSVGVALLLALFRRRKSLDTASWERLKW